MLKKRIIFTLLYDDGTFKLSRNFRLQSIGDINWLLYNYGFGNISFHIDELILLNVSKLESTFPSFVSVLESLSKYCFAPVAAGGNIRTLSHAKQLLNAGADKVVLNTSLILNQKLVHSIGQHFGRQSIIGSLDVIKKKDSSYVLYNPNIENKSLIKLDNFLYSLPQELIGEIYLNSVDRDGTGQGYDFNILSQLPKGWSTPIIIGGGSGNSTHFIQGLTNEQINAVSTAHLLNFVGNGLEMARMKVQKSGIDLAAWPSEV